MRVLLQLKPLIHNRIAVPSQTPHRLLQSGTVSSLPSTEHVQSNVYYLAHMNYARLKAPMDDPSMAEFKAAMDPINALAQRTPGYVWSLDYPAKGSDGDVPHEFRDDPLLMPQLSLWKNPRAIQHFAFKSGHFMYYKRKREWFTSPKAPWSVCWWFFSTDETPVPTLAQAFDRLGLLRESKKSTPQAFELNTAKDFPKPTP